MVTIDSVIKKYKERIDLTKKVSREDLVKLKEKYKEFEGKVWSDMVKIGGDQLLRYNIFRKEMVDSILAYSAQEAKCGNSCSAESVGSITPTSDYDITIYGEKRVDVVASFNENFRNLFGEESGNVFDTNIYGTAFYQRVIVPWDYFKIRESTYAKYIHIVKDYKAIDAERQRIWAFTKFNLFCLNNCRKDIETYLKSFRGKLASHYQASIKNLQKLKVEKRGDLEFMNKQYVETLKEEQILEKDIVENPFDEKKQMDYKDAISKSNFYGSETYFTQGAFFHVVGQMQSGIKDIPLTRDEYADSFIENIGDTLKDVSHYKADCIKMMIKLSKYLYRAFDAAKKAGIDNKYLEYTDHVLKIRNEIRGKNRLDPDDIKKINELLKGLGLKKCEEFSTWISKFFIDILNNFYK